MAVVTFTNPEYKDKSVYAVAGSHTQTILKLARENKIPIDFECEDGDCGTCVVKVTSLDDKGIMGGPLTEKEKSVLQSIGKISKAEMEQMIVRDEDIRIEY